TPTDPRGGTNRTAGLGDGFWVQGNAAGFMNLGASNVADSTLIGSLEAARLQQNGNLTVPTISRAVGDSTSTLTLLGDTTGTGIDNSGGALTINVPVVLGASQSWRAKDTFLND